MTFKWFALKRVELFYNLVAFYQNETVLEPVVIPMLLIISVMLIVILFNFNNFNFCKKLFILLFFL